MALVDYPTDTDGADGDQPHGARLVGYFHLGLRPGDRHGFVPLDDVAHSAEVERDTAPQQD